MFSTQFNAAEVLELAKDIEKKGYNFYKNQAEQTDEKELKQLFLKLAADEEDHYEIFNELSQEVKKEVEEDLDYIYDQEVSSYLQSLVEFTVFPPDSEKIITPDTTEKILLVAIMAEKDSILFYQEMLPYNKGETADTLRKLISEEKQHLVDLTSYREELTWVHCVYIVECSDGTLYTGYTPDIEERIKKHNRGQGAKYTRGRTPVTLKYQERYPDKSRAMQREYDIKQLSRGEKEMLIERGLKQDEWEESRIFLNLSEQK